ncbi:hypothetical protein AABB24_021658 [Solanum stoloniferum]|uniref:F-box associated beta-propeller type 1 domain-containing protein n=1 Tax=Solanum stoloniferum TaxID=62892 RepID=A0ABD2SWA3_9SOLN
MHKNLPDIRLSWKYKLAIYGFGYDELHEDYKVVGIFYNNHDGSNDIEVKIYSLRSDSWSSVDYYGDMLNTSGSIRKMRLSSSGLFANGKLHWDTIIVGPYFTFV